MSSSDIYKENESPWADRKESPPVSHRRSHSRPDSFDEVMAKDLSQTHRRRRKNRGFRRFFHLLKKPDFSKKFWMTVMSISGVILMALIIWDLFFRYPNP